MAKNSITHISHFCLNSIFVSVGYGSERGTNLALFQRACHRTCQETLTNKTLDENGGGSPVANYGGRDAKLANPISCNSVGD